MFVMLFNIHHHFSLLRCRFITQSKICSHCRPWGIFHDTCSHGYNLFSLCTGVTAYDESSFRQGVQHKSAVVNWWHMWHTSKESLHAKNIARISLIMNTEIKQANLCLYWCRRWEVGWSRKGAMGVWFLRWSKDIIDCRKQVLTHWKLLVLQDWPTLRMRQW